MPRATLGGPATASGRPAGTPPQPAIMVAMTVAITVGPCVGAARAGSVWARHLFPGSPFAVFLQRH